MSTLQDWATAPPGYVHETQVPLISALCITFPIMAFMFVGMRIYVRSYLLGGVGPDDWLALMGAVCMTGVTAITLWGAKMGYGTHIWEVKESSMQNLRTVITAVPFIAQIGNMFVQLTLLAFYCRLAPHRTFHYLCYVLMFISAFMSIFRVTFSSILCFHIHPDDGLICHDNLSLVIAHAVIGVTTNVVLFVLPIPLLWKLKTISVPRRLGLIAIFSVGLIAVGACLSKVFVVKNVMREKDPSWGMSWMAVICQVEVGAGLTCACLPMLRPLLLRTSTTPKGAPPVDDMPKEPRGGGSGNGTAILRRAKAGWDGKSLTATWHGVQRYYHTRWGRKRSIIEVADLEGLGVLGSQWDYPNHPGDVKASATPDSSEMHEFQIAGYREKQANQTSENQTLGEGTTLQSPTPVPSCHKPGISRDGSRRISRYQLSTTLHKGEEFDFPLPPRRPKTSESGDAVLLSSVAPMADGGSVEGDGVSTTTGTKPTLTTTTSRQER